MHGLKDAGAVPVEETETATDDSEGSGNVVVAEETGAAAAEQIAAVGVRTHGHTCTLPRVPAAAAAAAPFSAFAVAVVFDSVSALRVHPNR